MSISTWNSHSPCGRYFLNLPTGGVLNSNGVAQCDLAPTKHRLKTSGPCFFTAPIRLNPTTNTLLTDPPARFLFFALIAKYLDEIFPDPLDPEVYILSPDIPDTDHTRPNWCQYNFMFAFVVNLSSFLGIFHFVSFHSLVYIIQILTAEQDVGGNYHSRGAIHTGPTIILETKLRG